MNEIKRNGLQNYADTQKKDNHKGKTTNHAADNPGVYLTLTKGTRRHEEEEEREYSWVQTMRGEAT